MYEKYSFLGEEEQRVAKISDALQILKDRDYKTVKVPFKKIAITETGQVILDSKECQITKWGFERFCGMLGIPKPFARKIPEDLLNQNISRLIKEQSQDKEVLFFDSKKGLLGTADAKADPFEGTDFLTQMTTIHSGKADVHDVIVNDRGVTVNYFANIPNVEPKQGDIVKVGFNTYNSDTGGGPTASNLFLYRLVCQNGAVMGELWGSAKRTYNRKITKERALQNFVKDTEDISTNGVLLTKCFSVMTELQVADEAFKGTWASTKRVIGSDAATDEALDIEGEDRKALFMTIMKRQNQNRKRLIENLQPESPIELDRSYYDLYNQVTAIEKNHRLDDKTSIRKIGGEIIYRILKTKVLSGVE